MTPGLCLPQVTPGGSRMRVHMAQGLCWTLQRDPTAALTPRDQGPHSLYPLRDKPWGRREAVCGRGRGSGTGTQSLPQPHVLQQQCLFKLLTTRCFLEKDVPGS